MLWPSYSRNGVIGMTTGMSSSSLTVAYHSCGHAWSHTVQWTATYNQNMQQVQAPAVLTTLLLVSARFSCKRGVKTMHHVIRAMKCRMQRPKN